MLESCIPLACLKAEFGAGYGVDNLGLSRRLYQTYPCLLP